MGFLQDKKILITGVISNHSIAYGIAKACHREGAQLAFTYVIDKFEERLHKLAADFDSKLVYKLDVQNDTEINQLFNDLGKEWSRLDGLVHSIAFAPREAIEGDFLTGCTREAFHMAHDISSYSLPALARAAHPLMKDSNGSVVALTYVGSNQMIPNYNTMGLAKASLEAAVRYTASSLGKDGIRCNAVSAGAIKTLAAKGIAGFSKALKLTATQTLLKRNVSAEEIGNVVAFLLSDLSSAITGETVYADNGFNISRDYDVNAVENI